MHNYYVHKALFINLKIHGPRVKSLGSRMGPIWAYGEHVFIIENLQLYFHIHLRKKLNAWLKYPFRLLLILPNSWSLVQDSSP